MFLSSRHWCSARNSPHRRVLGLKVILIEVRHFFSSGSGSLSKTRQQRYNNNNLANGGRATICGSRCCYCYGLLLRADIHFRLGQGLCVSWLVGWIGVSVCLCIRVPFCTCVCVCQVATTFAMWQMSLPNPSKLPRQITFVFVGFSPVLSTFRFSFGVPSSLCWRRWAGRSTDSKRRSTGR